MVEGITIFYDTKEHPKKFSAVSFNAEPGIVKYNDLLGQTETLVEIRKLIPKSMKLRLDRKEDDDKTIIETWM